MPCPDAITIRLKRAYEGADPADGRRILVDRLWPRGVSKEAAAIDCWAKEIAPSAGLRKWFGHDPEKWAEFRSRYRKELKCRAEELEQIRGHAREGTVTLVYAAKDEDHNQALVLKDILEARG